MLRSSKRPMPTSRRSQPPLALAVPLSRFASRVGGGSAFFVDMATRHDVRFYSTGRPSASVGCDQFRKWSASGGGVEGQLSSAHQA